MIEISFREFFEYTYHEDGFHELYVLKNGLNETLYIGISSENIWNRWFGPRGHVMVGHNYLIGESSVGRKVVDHLPDSWEWKFSYGLWKIAKRFAPMNSTLLEDMTSSGWSRS